MAISHTQNNCDGNFLKSGLCACSAQNEIMTSGVARICCKEGQSWKLGHGALTANFRAGQVQQLLDDL